MLLNWKLRVGCRFFNWKLRVGCRPLVLSVHRSQFTDQIFIASPRDATLSPLHTPHIRHASWCVGLKHLRWGCPFWTWLITMICLSKTTCFHAYRFYKYIRTNALTELIPLGIWYGSQVRSAWYLQGCIFRMPSGMRQHHNSDNRIPDGVRALYPLVNQL